MPAIRHYPAQPLWNVGDHVREVGGNLLGQLALLFDVGPVQLVELRAERCHSGQPVDRQQHRFVCLDRSPSGQLPFQRLPAERSRTCFRIRVPAVERGGLFFGESEREFDSFYFGLD